MAVVEDDAAASRHDRTPPQSSLPLNHSKNTKKLSRKEKQLLNNRANRARHRLLSIQHDVETFLRPALATNALLKDLPLVANERCGSWYAYPLTKSSQEQQHSCYFKSTDGHKGTYNFSLKRLNLNVIGLQGCFIVDASVKKEMPDSFARTIPIWCAVLNRIAVRFRRELGMNVIQDWDDALYTPVWLVSEEEHNTMEELIDIRVQELYMSKAIVDPKWLATTLTKPLRPFWMTPQHDNLDALSTEKYFAVVCLNASQHYPNRVWNGKKEFWYTPGAADDHEVWARGLSPRLFWNHVEALLNVNNDDTDAAIDALVERERRENDEFEVDALSLQNLFDVIGDTKIAIGTRRAGRPPSCWQHFDAVLNVTDMEYPDMHDCCGKESNTFYLQLPVKEGKRDKSELERWMAVGIVFCVMHAQENRRILIHCAQGKDRSVAVAMAVIVLFCDLTFPLQWTDHFWKLSTAHLKESIVESNHNDGNAVQKESLYQSSGLSERLANGLQGRSGRDCFLEWVRKELAIEGNEDEDSPMATKETLRIALHLLRQDREKAEPSRSTMQKLNRFFMSSSYDR